MTPPATTTPPAPAPRRILVIKLGALGDMVLATGPFAAIRAAHPDAEIVLLTRPAFADFFADSPFFDAVWTDTQPRALDFGGWLALRRRLRAGGFDFVYDLQTSDRSGWIFRVWGWPDRARPKWSGIAPGCSHPHANPARARMHTIDRQAEQLAMAGIAAVPPPRLGWVKADIARFDLPDRYALLVPGGSAHRPEKRWPAANYGALAAALARRETTPIILGGPGERSIGTGIAAACPAARDLTAQTTPSDIVVLARGAAGAVGNDTGPMHLIAAADCPSLVLFSAASDPALTAPRGDHVTVLQCPSLKDLQVGEVAATLRLR